MGSRTRSGAGPTLAVETAADGTVVVLAFREGDVAFGSSIVRSGAFVVCLLEADGRPRFARGFVSDSAPILSVDPTGRIAVVGREGASYAPRSQDVFGVLLGP